MKSTLLRILLPLLSVALTACSAGELLPTADGVRHDTPSTEAARSALFPAADGSLDLDSYDPGTSFAELLRTMVPANALDLSMFCLADEQIATIKRKAEEVCAACKTDADRISKLNAWVHDYVSYGYSDPEPWAVFVSRRGVCQAYANLLKAMLVALDIPAVGVNGWISGFAHAWIYAYDGTSWHVCDPTNKAITWPMASVGSYSHLRPEMADVTLFCDADFEYNYIEGSFNVSRVKTSDSELVVPYSAHGYRIASFNPSRALPASVRTLYLGSGIRTIGQNIVGLVAYSASDEMCYVDPDNPWLASAYGIVYGKDDKGRLADVRYIPPQMSCITLKPMPLATKNTVYHHSGVQEIIFPNGTERLESYAIEDCPQLRTVYVPAGCRLDDDAIYRCPDDVQVVYGIPSAIRPVLMTR